MDSEEFRQWSRTVADWGADYRAGLRERPVRAQTKPGDIIRQISDAAHDLDVRADPTALQTVQLAIDTLVRSDVRPFWEAVLGYGEADGDDLVDPHGRGPSLWFQPMEASRPQRNRIHVDVSVPHDRAEA